MDTSSSKTKRASDKQLEAEAAANTPPEAAPKLENREPNLDAGYAWIMLVVVFLLNSTANGTSRVYGLVYARQISTGYYDHEQASWPIATASTIENLAGILTPALATVLSWRQIQLLSTSLFILSNLGAYFSDSLLVDVLCLGLIQGLALSAGTVLTLAINNDYFERFRTSAYGLAMSGSTCGVFLMAPIVEQILAQDPIHFRPVYLAIAGVLLINLALSLLIKPRAETRSVREFRRIRIDSEKKRSTSHKRIKRISLFESHFERSNSIASINIDTRSRRQSVLSRKLSVVGGQQTTGSESQVVEKKSSLVHQSQNQQDNADFLQKHILSMINRSTSGRQASSSSSPSRKSITGKSETKSERQPAAEKPSQTVLKATALPGSSGLDCARGAGQLADLAQTAPPPQPAHWCPADKEASGTIRESSFTEEPEAGLIESLKLLRGPYIHCVWLMLTIYYLVSRVFIIILPDFGRDHGMEPAQSLQLLNYWSVGELLGRLLLAAIIDLHFVSVKTCIVATCGLLGALIGLMVSLESIYIYAPCATLIAALVSLEYMLINALMVEYLGRGRAIGCYSVAALISSLLLFARPMLIGLFRDNLGSYDGLLILLAIICFSFAILFAAFEPLFVRLWPKQRNLN